MGVQNSAEGVQNSAEGVQLFRVGVQFLHGGSHPPYHAICTVIIQAKLRMFSKPIGKQHRETNKWAIRRSLDMTQYFL